MKFTFEYKTIEQREMIINDNKNLVLIEEQNLLNGNFLIFSDTIPTEEVIYINVPKKDLDELESRTTSVEDMLLQLMMEGTI